jgi:transcriptional regulator with GAF, ATPase, and Fis domain
MVAALDIKGCALFVLNSVSEELEIMASFGLSAKYLTKGPLSAPKSITETFKGNPVVIRDISKDNKLQYPDEAKKEGIVAIISLPVRFRDETMGALRLYHYEQWNIAAQDLDSLTVLADIVGLAMSYTHFRNATHAIAEIIGNTFKVQLVPKAG